MLKVRQVAKNFVLHAQGGAYIPVFNDLSFSLDAGEVLALTGPSGSGKSSLMRMIYGNYACGSGEILLQHDDRWVDVARAHPRFVLALRRDVMGYISQFLRVLPRVGALHIVMEPMLARGVGEGEAGERAAALLARLRIPERLWPLSPVTFSGGEQQRINIARGFAAGHGLLMLDEPTASLDAANRETVIAMIEEARRSGTAILGIFHDDAVRDAVATRRFEIASRHATEISS